MLNLFSYYTENIKIVVLTCSRFEFPSNGRLVDKHNRTPLHVVMITDPSPFSLEVRYILDNKDNMYMYFMHVHCAFTV